MRNIKSTIKYSNHGCTRSAKNPQFTTENILNRQFHADKPNEKWLTDVTEFKWYEGITGATSSRLSPPSTTKFQSTLPVRGATARTSSAPQKRPYFNPRSPYGERPGTWTALALPGIFQSTLPVRGATWGLRHQGRSTRDFNPRSPYGERQQAPVPGGGSRDFNPRSPYGERHGFLTFPLHLSNFNPRSPYGERLLMQLWHRRGRDFNPRSPYGERLGAVNDLADDIYFNPRSPYGERLCPCLPPPRRRYFNPRSPYGERRGRWSCSRRWRNFNPRSPYGERQCRSFVRRVQCRFQSTLPVRGATPQGLSVVVHRLISIHAPRTGSDARYSSKYCRLSEFQSTLPVRGATW